MAGHLTLALIKPHVILEKNVGRVIAEIEDAGFGIILSKMTQLRKEGAEEFYEEHLDKEFFDNLTDVMSSGALWTLVLAKPSAVQEWRDFIGSTDPAKAGPETIRHKFGDHKNLTNNAVHGSATDHDAKREINFFFAREIKLAERINSLNNNQAF